MNFLDSQGLLPSVVGFAISAILLWLGSEIFAAARQRPRGNGRRLKAWRSSSPASASGGRAISSPRSNAAGGSRSRAASLAVALAGLAMLTAIARRAGPCRRSPD